MSKKLIVALIIVAAVVLIYAWYTWAVSAEACSHTVDKLSEWGRGSPGVIFKSGGDEEFSNQMCSYDILYEDENTFYIENVTCNDEKIKEFERKKNLENSTRAAFLSAYRSFSIEILSELAEKMARDLESDCDIKKATSAAITYLLFLSEFSTNTNIDYNIYTDCDSDCFLELSQAKKSQINFYLKNLRFGRESVKNCKQNLPKSWVFKFFMSPEEKSLLGDISSLCPLVVSTLRKHLYDIKRRDINYHSKYQLLRTFYL
jgi:hypothetical protein